MSTARPTAEPAETGGRGLIDLDVPGAMRRRWWLVALALIACWGLAYWYVENASKVYESDVQLLVQRKNEQAISTRGGITALESGISDETLATHLAHITSRNVLETVLEETGLNEDKDFLSEVGPDEAPEEYLADQIEVTRGGEGQARDAQILRIAYRDVSPKRAKLVVEELRRQYETWLDENFKDESEKALELVAQARDDLKKDRDEAVEGLFKIRSEYPMLTTDDSLQNVHILNHTQYEEKKAESKALLAQKQKRLEIVVDGYRAQLKKGDPSPLTLIALISDEGMARIGELAKISDPISASPEFVKRNSQEMSLAQAQYRELLSLKSKLAEAEVRLGPNHETVKSLQRQIAGFGTFVEDMDIEAAASSGASQALLNELMNPRKILESYIASLQNDVRQLEGEITNFERLAAEEEAKAAELIEFELKKDEFEVAIERNNEMYQQVQQRLEEMQSAEDFGSFRHSVEASPRLGKEVWPDVPICFALATLMGLIVGGGGAVAFEATDTSFRNSDQVQRTLDLPVLAQIKSVKRVKTTADAPVSGDLITHFDTTSVDSEAFRSLRTSLLFKARENDLHSFGVTSANQGDGKSLVLGNLAVTLAQANKRVLLVDGDLRRPRTHTLFNLPGDTPGFVDVLQGHGDPDELTQTTGVNNLSLLPAGIPPENPAELLQSEAFRQFLKRSEAAYDFVLVDLPPVLAVSDPCIAAPFLGGIVFVLKVAKTRAPEAQDVVETIKAAGGEPVGVVINGHEAGNRFSFGGRGGVGTYYSDYGAKKGYVTSRNGAAGGSKAKTPPRNRVAAVGDGGSRNGVSRNGSHD